jgi:hypothetical protein
MRVAVAQVAQVVTELMLGLLRVIEPMVTVDQVFKFLGLPLMETQITQVGLPVAVELQLILHITVLTTVGVMVVKAEAATVITEL